jgi:hypothetical protein
MDLETKIILIDAELTWFREKEEEEEMREIYLCTAHDPSQHCRRK